MGCLTRGIVLWRDVTRAYKTLLSAAFTECGDQTKTELNETAIGSPADTDVTAPNRWSRGGGGREQLCER